jgi:phosphoribosylamine-glycine ligase
VLNVTGVGADVAEARARAYAAIDMIDWPGGFHRRDIGWRAFARDPLQLDRVTLGSTGFSGTSRP